MSKASPRNSALLVQARLASLIGKRHVTLAEIERRLLLASDVPGLALSSTITRGTAPGGTLLVLEATWNPVAGTLGVDNRLPPSLGNWELNGALAVNSPLGYGEQLYGAASTGYDLGKVFDATTPMQLLGAGAVLPIGVDGFKINPEYTNSVTRPAPFPGAPPDVGYYQRFDLRASYPLILTRNQALTFQATYEWAQEHLSPIGFDTDIYDDQYNVARLQLEDHLRLPYGLLAGTLVFSQGLGGRGETQAALTGIPLSQQGAFPTFSKLGLDATWTEPLPYDLQGALIGQGQTSFGHPLFIAEQFSLDGSQAASAYPLGTFSVDEGATLRGEIQRPLPVRLDAGPRDDRAIHFRRRLARLDRRPDCGAAGPHQRRIVRASACASARTPRRLSCRSERRSASSSLAGFRTSSARDRSTAAMLRSP